MIFKRLFLFTLSFLFLCPVYADKRVSVKEIEAIGKASTRNMALSKALKNAVFEVYGSAVIVADHFKEAPAFVGELPSDQSNLNTFNISAGLLKSYKIVEEEKPWWAFRWTVKVKAQVYQYNNLDKRKEELASVVVAIDSKDTAISQSLENSIVSQLLASGSFIVLERSQLKAIEAEKELLLSADAAIDQRCRLGKVLGADYIFSIALNLKDLQKQSSAGDMVPVNSYRYKGDVLLDLKMIEVAQRSIDKALNLSVSTSELSLANKKSEQGALFDFSSKLARFLVRSLNGEIASSEGPSRPSLGQKKTDLKASSTGGVYMPFD